MSGNDSRIDRLRNRQRNLRLIRPQPKKLSVLRPLSEQIPIHDTTPVYCQRCEEETAADAIQCVYADYWLCRSCARYHRGLIMHFRTAKIPDRKKI